MTRTKQIIPPSRRSVTSDRVRGATGYSHLQPAGSGARRQTAHKAAGGPSDRGTGSIRPKPGKNSSGTNGGKRPSRKNAPGILVMREIRKLQQSTILLILQRSFGRLVRKIAQKDGKDVHFQYLASQPLQEAAEFFLVSLFEDCNLASIHGRRVTIIPRDLSLVFKIREDRSYRLKETG